MKKVLVIAGPTAVGKTSLSIQLAKTFAGEVISGDSMQIYRQLDIGTAKVTEEEKEGVSHHLIDICDIGDRYSAADFQKQGRQKITEICNRGHLPIIVGGTGLYIQSLLYDYQLGATQKEQDDKLRHKYEVFAENEGPQALFELLEKKDPLAAKKIHMNNQRKIIRALEVKEKTGRSIIAPEKAPKPLYDSFMIGLTTDRSLLHARINTRVDDMIQSGLITEAALVKKYPDSQAAKGIGYKEFFPYFAKERSLQETTDLIKRNSRRYAKRQLTWFNNRMFFHWFDLFQEPQEIAQIKKEVAQWLEV
ncbi:tRNA delta(2)-isopentenylpyrophosphate transferase [Tetragenococcus halophilus subsp. halophilus]|uniref:tRNA dimethylallyltransferase n=2 Tax=Tetragenococcus halophilus TaxID=51669 RepID=A0A3G5FI19_TETHA|nr:tRNA (adenosine(37)-N6)-dimethylallyltransferase MiaA [Tetragenococcus halophilus]AOF48495.1 tRNA delta(2)-isopentenylpyrophosphate transferase [Tetragenococcus halophilus]AYW50003.1 tRNA (adenosine(37)-N6)-dimethylallyltransferase MiaA [Tetragenococcus halophilus]NWN99740.1 tRNA (adenosine(37)-N6)-dimethylallyltransferase MiaA [Tetragenococcus halophilus]QGP75971.1 tRNA (adenosine(37)-N6)-dimethylallyltransferase MiaA [Tetragenococcus halophilus]WJS81273.1 tRNA (adenosine(37)-N6)-dimethyla